MVRVNRISNIFNGGLDILAPSKVKLLRMTRGRRIVRRRCAVDGPLTCVKLYLEYNREIFQLILH